MSEFANGWSGDVLEFWFNELETKDWFMSSAELDSKISQRFGSTHAALNAQLPGTVATEGDHALACVIVLDQFSRNLYRGQAAAFASDELALSVTKQAVAASLDSDMSDDQKQFLYMPFMHSENPADQDTSVALFTALARPEYAVIHSDIIKQFGRYPHRNKVLGRTSTDAEIAYLENAKTFGQ